MKLAHSDYLVILGIDADKKPHAALFSVADEQVVRKCAELMGMRVGRTTDDEARALARKLPAGKLFATGKALVPLVRHAIYDDLAKVLTLLPALPNENGTKDAPGAGASNGDKQAPIADPKKLAAPDPWADVKVGSVMLCQDDCEEPGWWEVVVMTIGPDNETLMVRWRDYPSLKSFRAKRHALAFLPPQVTRTPAHK